MPRSSPPRPSPAGARASWSAWSRACVPPPRAPHRRRPPPQSTPAPTAARTAAARRPSAATPPRATQAPAKSAGSHTHHRHTPPSWARAWPLPWNLSAPPPHRHGPWAADVQTHGAAARAAARRGYAPPRHGASVAPSPRLARADAAPWCISPTLLALARPRRPRTHRA
eukprot:3251445-Pleurochrysis_carterae.AAC.7